MLVWDAPIHGVRMKWALSRLTSWIDDLGGSIIVLNIVLSTSSPPDADARRQFLKLPHANNRVRRFVTLAAGNGFWLSLVRTVVRGLAIATGQAGRFTVCGTLDESLSVVASSAGPITPRTSDLRVVLAEAGVALGTTALAEQGAQSGAK